ncbi:MAG: hypothetical protein PHE32_04070 [Candidatus Shapirobacteria bacterium]|nr:hypothetical protein [Candidatus Shapirobacteria bacterium]
MEEKKVIGYSELKNKVVQDKLTKIIDENKVFFAFSNEQLEKGLEEIGEKKENVISIGMGGIIPKKNLDNYYKQTKELNEWFIEEVKKLNPNAVICYELNNYEAYYTGDISTAYEVLKDYGFTKEDVLGVFHNRNYQLNKKND